MSPLFTEANQAMRSISRPRLLGEPLQGQPAYGRCTKSLLTPNCSAGSFSEGIFAPGPDSWLMLRGLVVS